MSEKKNFTIDLFRQVDSIRFNAAYTDFFTPLNASRCYFFTFRLTLIITFVYIACVKKEIKKKKTFLPSFRLDYNRKE